MKILVTGAAGLQGSHLSEQLMEMGHEVSGVDNYSRGLFEAEYIVRSDLRDGVPSGMMEGVDVVYHLAAQVWGAEYTKSHNWDMLQHNMQVDANVFQSCVDAGVRRVIYPSTACVYPVEYQQQWNSELTEGMAWGTTPLFPTPNIEERFQDTYAVVIPGPHPESGYGWAKLMGEVQLTFLPLDWVIFRLFNVYGKGENPGTGSHVIPNLVRKILAASPGGVVKGIANGRQGRSFLYVDDAVRAYTQALKCPPGAVMNIGVPEPIKVRTLAAMLCEIDGRGVRVEYDDEMPDSEARQLPEIGVWGRTPGISRAKAILDWKPQVSLQDGLERVYLDYANRNRSVVN